MRMCSSCAAVFRVVAEMEWKLLAERLLHAGYRKVFERRYQMPSGREALFEITQTADVACALALDESGRLILTRQFRPGPGRLLYVPPGGIIDEGESPEQAMHRELREETGFDGTLIPLHRGIQSAYTTGCRYHFLAVGCQRVQNAPSDPDEVASVEFVDPAAVGELLSRSELADVETVLAGLSYLRDHSHEFTSALSPRLP